MRATLVVSCLTLSVVAVAVAVRGATLGLDVSEPVSTSNAACLMSAGYKWSVTRAWHSYGAFDTNAPATVAAFNAAGFHADVYLFPCAGSDAASQMNGMLDKLAAANTEFGVVWLDIETNPSTNCGWAAPGGSGAEQNCQFLLQLLEAGNARGVQLGVYASHYMWSQIFDLKCNVASSRPLWYADYENVKDCSDLEPFGGWTSAAWHQYADNGGQCNTSYDISVNCAGIPFKRNATATA